MNIVWFEKTVLKINQTNCNIEKCETKNDSKYLFFKRRNRFPHGCRRSAYKSIHYRVYWLLLSHRHVAAQKNLPSHLFTHYTVLHIHHIRKKRRNKNLSRRLTACELFVYYLCLFVVIIIIAKRFHFFFCFHSKYPQSHFFPSDPWEFHLRLFIDSANIVASFFVVR